MLTAILRRESLGGEGVAGAVGADEALRRMCGGAGCGFVGFRFSSDLFGFHPSPVFEGQAVERLRSVRFGWLCLCFTGRPDEKGAAEPSGRENARRRDRRGFHRSLVEAESEAREPFERAVLFLSLIHI